MDTDLRKLLEVWELNEDELQSSKLTSLFSNPLPPTLARKDEQGGRWGVEGSWSEDSALPATRNKIMPAFTATPEPSKAATCTKCGHFNEYTCHWCEECGCSLLPPCEGSTREGEVPRVWARYSSKRPPSAVADQYFPVSTEAECYPHARGEPTANSATVGLARARRSHTVSPAPPCARMASPASLPTIHDLNTESSVVDSHVPLPSRNGLEASAFAGDDYLSWSTAVSTHLEAVSSCLDIPVSALSLSRSPSDSASAPQSPAPHTKWSTSSATVQPCATGKHCLRMNPVPLFIVRVQTQC